MFRRFEPQLRRLRHIALAATALLCVACAGWSEAHDWVSPARAATPAPIAQRWPAPPPVLPDWPHRVWAGPASGPPAAPDARDCQRAPQTLDLPGLEGPQSLKPGDRRTDSAREMKRLHEAEGFDPPVGAAAPAAPLARSAPREESADRAKSSVSSAATADERVMSVPQQAPQPAPQRPRQTADTPVTAGVVDDNADFGAYLAYRQRNAHLPVRPVDVEERYLLTVHDAAGRPVNDAEVTLHARGRALPLWARTDAGGQVWIHPEAVARPQVASNLPRYAEWRSEVIEVQVRRGDATGRALLTRGQRDGLQVRLDTRAPTERARLDLVFLIDATGSMGDEIDKLKRSMRQMADQIARLPSRPDICFALVAYRDRGDAFFVRAHDFSADLGAFQRNLGALQAGGGGDYPEALNEALHTAVHRLSWRGDGATRLVVLVADAPPHLDYGSPTYDDDMQGALARGIKLFAVGASGLDPTGEYVFRQAAQYTGGRFVFLTYANAADPSSGPGRETTHDVGNYSVESLDKLVVRLVREELARRPAS